MSAVSDLIVGLPLQPEEADRDVMDAKSQLFQKYKTFIPTFKNSFFFIFNLFILCFRYFSLFMNLLNDCSVYDTGSGFESETVSLKGGTLSEHNVSGASGPVLQSRRFVENKMEQLRSVTVEAMSNLLAANIDSGLVHSIGIFIYLFTFSNF